MSNDLIKFAERKMPLFNLVVSIWQHKLALENTIGVGFTKSIFTHKDGLCSLNVSQKEIDDLCTAMDNKIRISSFEFQRWYEKAKILNSEADRLIESYGSEVDMSQENFDKAFEVFSSNFAFCTVVPYWILYTVDVALNKGAKKENYLEILKMFEELKSETRYPQLIQIVIGKYFTKGAALLNVDPDILTCIHPQELREVIAGKKIVSGQELLKRMNGCEITRGSSPYLVDFNYKSGSETIIQRTNEISGKVAFKGLVRGTVKIINTLNDIEKFNDGDILVSIQSSPSLMPAIIRSSAIITDEGGIMCHASVISRELKKPCIIGTKIATRVLKDGDLVEVDAEKGIVKLLNK